MPRMRKSVFVCMASAFALGCALPELVPVARAQASGDQGANEINEIIVTARRVEERLQDVPISISVLNEKQLDDRNITFAADLATFTPSLSADPLFGNESTSFGLRGFQQDVGTNPTVAVYFADVVEPRGGFGGIVEHAGDTAGPGDFFDLQNVQVLKGPQGTLFGRNTTGGAVLLVPQKPTNTFEGYAEVSGGNYSMERVQAVVNAPLSDKVLIRVGVTQETQDGYEPNIGSVGPSAFGNINYVAGRVSAIVMATDEIENYTVASFAQSDNNGTLTQMFGCNANAGVIGVMACAQLARNQPAQAGNPWAVDNDATSPESYSRKWQIINTTTWTPADNLTVKNIASYAQLEVVLNTSLLGTDLTFPASISLGGFNVPTGPLGGQHVTFVLSGPGTLENVDQETFTEELQVHGNSFDNKLDWQAGLYMEGSHPLAITGTSSPSVITCSNYLTLQCFDTVGAFYTGLAHFPITAGSVTDSTGELSNRDYAVYGQAIYTITDQLKITGGLRVTEDITNAGSTRFAYEFPLGAPSPVKVCQSGLTTLATNCFAGFHSESRAPTWLMDLDYTPFEDILTYVKYARGYRQGGVTPTGADGYTVYQPEQVDSYEIGAKTSFHGMVSGLFDMAAFYNDFSNQQINATFYAKPGEPFPPTPGTLNAGSSRIFGAELSAKLSPYEGLTIDAEYTYLNSKLNTIVTPVLAANSVYGTVIPGAAVGTELPYSPRNKATLTVTYLLPIDPSLGRLSVSSTFTYTGHQLIQDTPFGNLPSNRLFDIDADWDSIGGRPIDLSFFMTNVTNVRYSNYVADLSTSAGMASRSLAPPRMFGGRLRYRF